MEEIRLSVQVRNDIGEQACKKVRLNNFIPGVVYGQKHKTTAIKVERGVFERFERQHGGGNIIIHLDVMEGDKKLKDYATLVKEVQHDPATDRILHIDFYAISLTKEIEVKVPIVAKGEAIGVKKEGGSLEHLLWELEVVCLPTKIPQKIEIDVSNLNINDSIFVKNLVLPEGVKTKQDPESRVITVAPPMKEEVAVPAEEAAAPEEPEVIKEKKKEEGAEEAAAAGKEKAEKTDKAKEKPKEEKPEGK